MSVRSNDSRGDVARRRQGGFQYTIMSDQQPKNHTSISPARRVAYAAMVTALSLVLLYLLYVLPTMRLAILFMLSLLPVILAYEKRYVDAALAFAAAALLSGLMFPAQGSWLLFAAFFGWYGFVREFITSRLNRTFSWAVLLVLFNAALFILYFTSSQLLEGIVIPEFLKSVPLPFIVIPAAEIAFVLFELLFGMCREYYVRRVRKLLYRQ